MSCGCGFRRSSTVNGIPMSLIHSAISRSDYAHSISKISRKFSLLTYNHEGIGLLSPIRAVWLGRVRHAHATVKIHGCGLSCESWVVFKRRFVELLHLSKSVLEMFTSQEACQQ